MAVRYALRVELLGLLLKGGLLLAAVACGALAYGCFSIGQAAGWTSDGPGMLLVMLGLGGFGLGALFFLQMWALACWGGEGEPGG